MFLMYILHVMTSNNSEHFVKVVDMEDIMKVNRLEGYNSGVRSATWHPSGTFLVSISSRELYLFFIRMLGNMYLRWQNFYLEHVEGGTCSREDYRGDNSSCN